MDNININIFNIDKYMSKIIITSDSINNSFEKNEEERNVILKLLNSTSPALNRKNHVPFYFFPPEKIKVSSSDNFQFLEIIKNVLYYLPSPQFPLKIELNFDPDQHKNVSIITFNSNYTKFLDPQTNQLIEFNNYLSNYTLCENHGNKINVVIENIYSTYLNYVDDQEINIDKYMCLSDVLLRCDYHRDLENIYKHKELYKDKIEESIIDNTLYYSANLNPFKFKELKLDIDLDVVDKYKNIYSELFNKDFIDELIKDKVKKDKYDIVKEFNYYLEFDLILKNPFSLNIFRLCLIRLQNNVNEYFDDNEISFCLNFINKLITSIEEFIKS